MHTLAITHKKGFHISQVHSLWQELSMDTITYDIVTLIINLTFFSKTLTLAITKQLLYNNGMFISNTLVIEVHVWKFNQIFAQVVNVHLTSISIPALFVCAVVLRFLPSESAFEAARIVYGVTLLVFFFRLLRVFSVNQEMGPKLEMIKRMVWNSRVQIAYSALYCKHGYFHWGKFSQKYWQDLSHGGNFHYISPISLLKSYEFYLPVGEIFAKKTISRKNAKIAPTWKFPGLQYIKGMVSWMCFKVQTSLCSCTAIGPTALVCCFFKKKLCRT